VCGKITAFVALLFGWPKRIETGSPVVAIQTRAANKAGAVGGSGHARQVPESGHK
jgi:hypothetical protein